MPIPALYFLFHPRYKRGREGGIKHRYFLYFAFVFPQIYWSQKELKLCTFSAFRFQLLKILPLLYGKSTHKWSYRI